MSTFKSRGLGGKAQGQKQWRGAACWPLHPRAWRGPITASCGAWWSEKDSVPSASMGYQRRRSNSRGGQTCVCECKDMQAGRQGWCKDFHSHIEPSSQHKLTTRERRVKSTLPTSTCRTQRAEQPLGRMGVKEPESRWGGVWEGLHQALHSTRSPAPGFQGL